MALPPVLPVLLLSTPMAQPPVLSVPPTAKPVARWLPAAPARLATNSVLATVQLVVHQARKL